MNEDLEQVTDLSGLQKTAGEQPWWFSEGLHFECLGCGRCCRGEAGGIFMRPVEERRVAEEQGLSLDDLRRRFETNRWRFPSLKERSNGSCIMLGPENRCSIYRCRPLACRTWPFWPEVLASRSDWKREACHCPGMNSGPVWNGWQIEKILNAHNNYMKKLSNEWRKAVR